ncbi:cytochrome P450 family protein [Streptomyces cinereoruber]|uniref:Cytochrome P450 n=1 Tax=Streptomyces cinereoruber TaxID=67260 RepID=A0ABX6BNY7_9ACTN|nr:MULTISPECIES: cytochrome P450 [Streptomyces]MBB4161199.1 cytochrome P450 [Streptomyces cinereoruber]MBY8819685.1 cytochrome P450 [Streptomyces cinereoruber]NIH63577.1 cytochrome P450 [Streptomyces cinereoruber]PVC76324.1 cytochrome P450 [Streptomyces sp. CS081A]QEV36203.1 cytochrome P450 [Streptomyces cinereoruber]
MSCPYDHTAASGTDVIDLDPFVTDLDGESARLRAAGPLARVVLPGGVPCFAVTHHAEARKLLTDPRLVKDIDVWGAWQRGEIPLDWPLIGLANPGKSMLTVDGEEHRRLRGLVAQALTARRVERLRAGIEALTTEMLDRLAERPAGETVDLKAEFAYPLPMNVVCELMGVERADQPRMKELFDKFFSTQTPPEEVPQMMADLGALFSGIVAGKKETPGDDLTSALIEASEDGDRLTTEEITNTLQLMVAAGHETTISLIVNAVVALSTHPEQRDLVLKGEVPWENVIEETLRWSTPTSHVLIRFAAEDIEVGDRVLPKGEGLIVSFGAIGRDEAQFGPTAGDFDVTRTPNRHISFGHGPHVCPGAALSRLEASVALPALYARFPELRLAVPREELRNKPVVTQNDLFDLPVVLA